MFDLSDALFRCKRSKTVQNRVLSEFAANPHMRIGKNPHKLNFTEVRKKTQQFKCVTYSNFHSVCLERC